MTSMIANACPKHESDVDWVVVRCEHSDGTELVLWCKRREPGFYLTYRTPEHALWRPGIRDGDPTEQWSRLYEMLFPSQLIVPFVLDELGF